MSKTLYQAISALTDAEIKLEASLREGIPNDPETLLADKQLTLARLDLFSAGSSAEMVQLAVEGAREAAGAVLDRRL